MGSTWNDPADPYADAETIVTEFLTVAGERRLAGAVRSVEDEPVARPDTEREVVQHQLVAEAVREAIDQNHVRSLGESNRAVRAALSHC